MGKTSERLEAYQTQMSIYAEQHKIILASDVLDMIEQLQDDLKDDTEKVVATIDEALIELEDGTNCGTCVFKEVCDDGYDCCTQTIVAVCKDIVRKGGVE